LQARTARSTEKVLHYRTLRDAAMALVVCLGEVCSALPGILELSRRLGTSVTRWPNPFALGSGGLESTPATNLRLCATSLGALDCLAGAGSGRTLPLS
jgi:hypothetical protein